MLEKTTNKPLREREFYRRLKGIDPTVPGLIFWPILFGMVLLLGSLALSMR
jgi:hypothetical protein